MRTSEEIQSLIFDKYGMKCTVVIEYDIIQQAKVFHISPESYPGICLSGIYEARFNHMTDDEFCAVALDNGIQWAKITFESKELSL